MAYTIADVEREIANLHKDSCVFGYTPTMTVEDAINAVDDRPFMDALRSRQEKWQSFWGRRGSNPVEYNPETAH